MRRADTNIDGDVKGFAFDHATEFSLGMIQLIVKAAKRSLGGTGVVVLDEAIVNAETSVLGSLVGFGKKTARVAMNYRTQFKDARKSCLHSLHVSQFTEIRGMVR